MDEPVTLYDAVGCEECGLNGLKGRRLVIEVLTLDDELNEIIANQETQGHFYQQAIKSGFKTMAEDGIRLILEGKTTLEELSRVVDLTARLK